MRHFESDVEWVSFESKRRRVQTLHMTYQFVVYVLVRREGGEVSMLRSVEALSALYLH
jgi:hypothetical protein